MLRYFYKSLHACIYMHMYGGSGLLEVSSNSDVLELHQALQGLLQTEVLASCSPATTDVHLDLQHCPGLFP